MNDGRGIGSAPPARDLTSDLRPRARIEHDTGASSVSLPREQVKEVGIAVGRHVQGAFARRGAALRARAAGKATTREDVDVILAG